MENRRKLIQLKINEKKEERKNLLEQISINEKEKNDLNLDIELIKNYGQNNIFENLIENDIITNNKTRDKTRKGTVKKKMISDDNKFKLTNLIQVNKIKKNFSKNFPKFFFIIKFFKRNQSKKMNMKRIIKLQVLKKLKKK